MLWEIDIMPIGDDRAAEEVLHHAQEAGLLNGASLQVATARGFLLEEPSLSEAQVQQIANGLLVDAVAEHAVVSQVGDASLATAPERLKGTDASLLCVMPKSGVMDPVARSTEQAIADMGLPRPRVTTLRKYWLAGIANGAGNEVAERLASRVLANDAIEQVIDGPISLETIAPGGTYDFQLVHVSMADLDDDGLMRLSREGQLYLQLAEMQTIQKYFADLGRDPTDIELETLAQTWSEHCSHKTLAGRISYTDENGTRSFENMLKETIFAATNKLRKQWGDDDWCVSVFADNAGIVKFDGEDNVCFKVETHNHPSALEPYGGANTGLGGVIRDTLGTGLGAKPVANTDIFCFAPPNTPVDSLPAGVLHPRRVMRGVVEGVRDYGNRMGIPTVNGAICFDDRYLGNPLVFCGSAGLLPHEMSFKKVGENDLIVSIGGRTGRDGIHGATFSSAELTSESEELSGGAVQIGNAIEEKQVMDVLLQARDQGLYTAVTDCGAGGFSSAVGEMGEETGAEVWLEKAPLKYDGLSYTEIWISEAQERMVFSVPKEKWPAFEALCQSEKVEACVIGRFTPTQRLLLKYDDQVVADLPMSLLHDGRPPVVREAVYKPAPAQPLSMESKSDYTDDLLKILGSLNVASKEAVIRQYDHEVQGGSVVKPLVGIASDGPSDAAVLRPKLNSRRGLVLSCGINPHYGDLDPYAMAASAIDEAIRNCVAVGADPSMIAVLDNFCWGDCERAETLGSLVRAALACHDLALDFQTPFVSGKDSLNNEFSYLDEAGNKQTIAIPATLLISAMGQIDDIGKSVTMDCKAAGNLLYLVGTTKDELGGSHYGLVNNLTGGSVPTVDGPAAKQLYTQLHQALSVGLVASCHDLSEGGLAVALAEMAFAGGLGIEADLASVPGFESLPSAAAALFSESNTRLLCEVTPDNQAKFEQAIQGQPCAKVGSVVAGDLVSIRHGDQTLVEATNSRLKQAWQSALTW